MVIEVSAETFQVGVLVNLAMQAFMEYNLLAVVWCAYVFSSQLFICPCIF